MHLFKAGATIERITVNACNAVRDCYACKSRTVFKSILSNIFDITIKNECTNSIFVCIGKKYCAKS